MTWKELATKILIDFTTEQLDQSISIMVHMSLCKEEEIQLRKTLSNPGTYYLVIGK